MSRVETLPESGPLPVDLDWVNSTQVNLYSVKETCVNVMRRRCVKGPNQAAWQFRAVTCIDLTTLSGDDTTSNPFRLCFKATNPLCNETTLALGMSVTTGRSFVSAQPKWVTA
ncbi:putative deoxyribose-phosphate aldolase-like [Tropilaelaps mercedesae]|uniref:Putative deoxyribose-phosphate aldolase-like n=1 Tax=Tropilaelaps mercedesae TaxID=418985 RepID=A0A1V9X2S6_9ACAR|nr:putative deoxyribose-phosphate aldolase-like [Tropilaelaps mercedesae]